MWRITIFIILLTPVISSAQSEDSSLNYKRRVLENTEIDIISSYYQQDGQHASVTGGLGNEELTDAAGKIVVSIPVTADDVLTINAKVSAYTSASSGNVNPFKTSASQNLGIEGSPWVASSGASESDELISGAVSFSHSSDNRNNIWSANINFSQEYDFKSMGIGGGFTKLFNEKNTEINLNTIAQIGEWDPYYPVELDDYIENNGDLYDGIFEDADILKSNGFIAWKEGIDIWAPHSMSLLDKTSRNTFSASLSLSQILSTRAQISFISDIIYQNGWLGNPMQRVYFADKDDYYMGVADNIPVYSSKDNTSVFQLADDIERLPAERIKVPVGLRFNYYINEFLITRTYYRFYADNWGVRSHTASLEVPIKIHLSVSKRLTLYPSYRFYIQSEARYFEPFNEHLSTSEFYTSDYDLSAFHANQYGFGIKYTDILNSIHVSKIGLKEITLNYAYYKRNIGFEASIFTLGLSFEVD
jgi:hypothetical protein